MRPLHAAAGGVVVVAIDFRTVAVDLLPDVAGWALLAYAVGMLLGARPALVPAAAGVLASADLVLPYHRLQYDPIAGELVRADRDLGYNEFIEYDQLTGARLAMVVGALALGAATILLLTETLHQRALEHGAGRSARQLRVAGWGTCALWVAPVLVAGVAGLVGGGGLDPVWGDPASRVLLVGIVAALALAALLLRDAREPWALRPGPLRLLPSAARAPAPAGD